MLTDGVARGVRGFGVAHDAGPQCLLLCSGVAFELFDQFLEQTLAFRGFALGGGNHGQQGAMVVVVFHQTTKDIGVAAKLGSRRAADASWHLLGNPLGFGDRRLLGLFRSHRLGGSAGAFDGSGCRASFGLCSRGRCFGGCAGSGFGCRA